MLRTMTVTGEGHQVASERDGGGRKSKTGEPGSRWAVKEVFPSGGSSVDSRSGRRRTENWPSALTAGRPLQTYLQLSGPVGGARVWLGWAPGRPGEGPETGNTAKL